MEELKENIAKIRKRCNEANLNIFRYTIELVDNLWWYSTDNIKFEHGTGVDHEKIEEEDNEFYQNSYIRDKINNNILDILHKIDINANIKKKNSIIGKRG